ncbi:MAG TPA: hypothetical protein PK760_11750, partial [Flavobacteriales bacterium]|nr:hypothetical protein [Flavobacteriales bacterium]
GFNVLTSAADVDMNGALDLVVGGVQCVRQGDGASFSGGQQTVVAYKYQSVGDIDCDPFQEIVLSGSSIAGILTRKLTTLPGYPDLAVPSLPGSNAHFASALADLDGDGERDLLFSRTDIGQPYYRDLFWRRNNSAPLDVSLDIQPDTLTSDTVMQLNGAVVINAGGSGFYSGAGVVNDTLHTAGLPDGFVLITYQHADWNSATYCTGVAVDSIFLSRGVGVEERIMTRTNVFPDPADRQTTLRCSSAQRPNIDLINMDGRLVDLPLITPGSRAGDWVITTQALANGSYVLRWRDTEERTFNSVLLMVQH